VQAAWPPARPRDPDDFLQWIAGPRCS
jgi:hypothetical protein